MDPGDWAVFHITECVACAMNKRTALELEAYLNDPVNVKPSPYIQGIAAKVWETLEKV